MRRDPIKDVTALRNLALALNLNRQDTEAAKMAREFIAAARLVSACRAGGALSARRIAGSDLRSGRKQQRNLAVAGDGQLLFWNGRELSLSVTILI